MNALLHFLTEPRLPLWKYSIAAFPIALIPSVAIYAGVYLLLSALGTEVSGMLPPARSSGIGEFVGTVVLAPIAETAVLALLVRGLLALTDRHFLIATVSGLLWGALHATLGLLWFFGTAWSFFVFSSAYLGWRKQSLHEAFAAAAIPHMLVNLCVAVPLAVQNAA